MVKTPELSDTVRVKLVTRLPQGSVYHRETQILGGRGMPVNAWIAFAVGYLVLLLYFFLFRFVAIRSDELEYVRWRRVLIVIAAMLAIVFLVFAPFSRSIIGRTRRQTTGTIHVWVNSRSGFYYCPGAEFYGRIKPGAYMTESDAIQSGYQPPLGQACR